MKRTFHSLVILGIVAALWAMPVQQSRAQEETSEVVTFASVGFQENTLRGPFDSTRLLFGLPADWKLSGDAEVQLDLSTFFGGIGILPTPQASGEVFGGMLEVSFNDVTLTAIPLDTLGERQVTLEIPDEALVPTRADGRHSLTLFLDAALNCDFDTQTSVVVRPTSRFTLPHKTTPPQTDLTKLPRPIFQNSFEPEMATVVVSSQPTPAELQAALAVAAGFGRSTGGRLLMALTTADQLATETRDATHIILVGHPDGLPLLNELSLPAPVAGSNFDAPGASPDDGILQMVVSPWNSRKVVLVIGGNSDAGVIKAGQAVSTGTVRVGGQPNLGLVAEVQPEITPGPTTVDRTLADVGHKDITVSTPGANSISYRFYVPPGQTLESDAYFDLKFTHSTLLEYERSGMTVNLNGQPIGSVRFSDDTAAQGQTRLIIPPTLVRPGINQIELRIDLIPRSVCVDPRLARLWLRADSTSLLHLPLSLAQGNVGPFLNLNQYPAPFVLGPQLSNLAFVLAPNDPTGWNLAAQIAFDLGDRSEAMLANLAVAYADAVPEEVRQGRDLIVVGRPSTLPILAELGDALPAPFAPGSDMATERNLQVIYNLPPGTDVGYLELLAAPWNNQRAVLAVLGSTNQGLQWVGAALTVPGLRSQLAGNFAAISGDQVVAADTRFLVAAAVPQGTAQPGDVIQVPPGAETSIVQRPPWILPALGLTIMLMFLILAIVAVRAIQQRRAKT